MNDYNTKRKALPLPEYGRSVQNMVDYCLTLTDRKERQQCAETIVQIMENMNPQYKGVEDFEHKLWDHLALMAEYKLDIDYPYEIVPQLEPVKPNPVSYGNEPIRYRHYGVLLERLVAQLTHYPEGPAKQELIAQTAAQMKRSMQQWNSNAVEDEKIIQDLYAYTLGTVRATPDMLQLAADNRSMSTAGAKKNGKKKKR